MKLNEYIGVIVKRTDLKLNNYYQKVVKPYNITIDQWMVLVVLWEEEGLSQNELAERTYGVPPAVLRAYAWIRALGAEGLTEVAQIACLNNNYLYHKSTR